MTVFSNLIFAVHSVLLAALLFMSRVAAPTTVSQVTDDYVEDGHVHILQDKDILFVRGRSSPYTPQVPIRRNRQDFCSHRKTTRCLQWSSFGSGTYALDATGLFAIEEVARQLHASRRTLILCGAREQPS